MTSAASGSGAGMRRPPSPPAGWRSIRPWNRLTLHVREITPVSATFILSSSIGLRTWDDSDDFDDPTSSSSDPHHHHAGPSQPKHQQYQHPLKPLSMSELLGKGLAVKVNNAPWQRVVMHIDDDADSEAIVILYGLHPARTYDIELALVAGEESIRGKISTEAASAKPPDLDEEDTVAVVAEESFEEEAPIPPATTANFNTNTTTQSLTPAATRPATPTPSEPPPSMRPLTVEERASQLLHELTSLDAEKESLSTRLKTLRKESQRADAALKSEIEALKRASERSAQTDHRSRQKILALQEATKQSLAASVEADEQVREVERSLPPLEQRVRQLEVEYARIKEKSGKDHAAASEAIKQDKKAVADLEAEVLALNHRLERLNARKDRLVVETVPDLEKELKDLGVKIEETERRGNVVAGAGMQTPPLSDEDIYAQQTHHSHSATSPHFTSLRSQLAIAQNAPPGIGHGQPMMMRQSSGGYVLNPLASPQDIASRSPLPALPPTSSPLNAIFPNLGEAVHASQPAV